MVKCYVWERVVKVDWDLKEVRRRSGRVRGGFARACGWVKKMQPVEIFLLQIFRAHPITSVNNHHPALTPPKSPHHHHPSLKNSLLTYFPQLLPLPFNLCTKSTPTTTPKIHFTFPRLHSNKRYPSPLHITSPHPSTQTIPTTRFGTRFDRLFPVL